MTTPGVGRYCLGRPYDPARAGLTRSLTYRTDPSSLTPCANFAHDKPLFQMRPYSALASKALQEPAADYSSSVVATAAHQSPGERGSEDGWPLD